MKLSERSVGWLRHLHRKAHTPDDWSQQGRPHPHWDVRSESTAAESLRFDLVESSYAMGLMAHTTPAWTEGYVAVLDQLIERHTSSWAIDDWLSWSDHRAVWGHHADVEPAFMLVLLGIRSMVANTPAETGDRWNEPFELPLGSGHNSTHTAIAEELAAKWSAAPPRCDCDDSWPHCLIGAGLGLKLHDQRYGSDLHDRVFMPWWNGTGRDHLGLGPGPALDPQGSPHRAVAAARSAAPQHLEEAQRLFEAADVGALVGDEKALPAASFSTLASGLLLAREWEMPDLRDRLASAIDAAYGPTWDNGEFAWHLGLDEPHPRGQFNARLAAAEANEPGSWERLFTAPLEPCPQVVDLDFPDMALDRAEWVGGNLHLGLCPRHEDPERFTYFRLVGAEPRMWDVHGVPNARIESTLSGLNVRVPMVRAEMSLIRSSY